MGVFSLSRNPGHFPDLGFLFMLNRCEMGNAPKKYILHRRTSDTSSSVHKNYFE